MSKPLDPRQRRITPFKVLAFILYGDFDFIDWTTHTVVKLSLGPLARQLGVTNYKLRDYLRWLAEYGYLENLDMTYGTAICRIALPKPLRGLI